MFIKYNIELMNNPVNHTREIFVINIFMRAINIKTKYENLKIYGDIVIRYKIHQKISISKILTIHVLSRLRRVTVE